MGPREGDGYYDNTVSSLIVGTVETLSKNLLYHGLKTFTYTKRVRFILPRTIQRFS